LPLVGLLHSLKAVENGFWHSLRQAVCLMSESDQQKKPLFLFIRIFPNVI